MKFKKFTISVTLSDGRVSPGGFVPSGEFDAAAVPIGNDFYTICAGDRYAVLTREGIPLFGADTIGAATAIVSQAGFAEAAAALVERVDFAPLLRIVGGNK